jgi:hypothetical protein
MQNTGFNSKKQQIAGEAASDWKTKKILKKTKKILKKIPSKVCKGKSFKLRANVDRQLWLTTLSLSHKIYYILQFYKL